MIDVRQEDGIVEVSVSRRVTEAEVESFKRRLEATALEDPDPRVLCSLSEFWGFDSHALWQDFVYWLRYFSRPARVALLADRPGLALLARSRFAPPSWIVMRGFEAAEEAEARRWLGEEDRARVPWPGAVTSGGEGAFGDVT